MVFIRASGFWGGFTRGQDVLEGLELEQLQGRVYNEPNYFQEFIEENQDS